MKLLFEPRAIPILLAIAAGLLAPALFAGSVGAQGRAGARMQIFERSPLTIVSASTRHQFTVELARTGRQQIQGLMFRRRMARNAGMLFIYRTAKPVEMWMKNTLIPLDMLFLADDGRIVSITERAVPHSLQTISSGVPAKGVLEVNGGVVSRLKIRVGDRVVHPAFANPR